MYVFRRRWDTMTVGHIASNMGPKTIAFTVLGNPEALDASQCPSVYEGLFGRLWMKYFLEGGRGG